jgi:predicted MFS family arabinose efflux permease
VNFGWALVGLRESLPPELRATKHRSLAPLNLAAARDAFARPGIALAVTVNFVLILSFTLLDQTFRYFTKDLFGMRAVDTGLVLMFVGVTAAGVQGVLMRPLSRRFDEPTLIRAGLVLQCAAFVGIAVSPSFGLVALFLSSGLLAVGNGLTQPSIPAYVSKRADVRAQGETLGTNQSAAALARVFGPALGGWIYGAYGPRSPYVTSAVGMFAATLLALALRSEPKARRSAELF